MKLTSSAFEADGPIPTRHTGEGDDVSPPLEWSGAPDGTRQFALICHDPDAPMLHGYTHWLVYGIPASESAIPEGGGDRFTQGTNDFGNEGYGGPIPPEGHGTHRYYFWLYALDTEVTDRPGLTRDPLLSRIEDHVIEQARLVGSYER